MNGNGVDIITIVYAILIFVALIFFHELGHFIAAKSCGVRVNEFAIGLGPALLKKQVGETVYAIRALPFGGQCVMEGEDEESYNPRAFNNVAKWRRLIILISGVAMNFLMGVVIFLCLYAPVERTTVPVVDTLMEKFTGGGEQGIMEGDRIISIDGYRILFTADISTALSRSSDAYYDVTLERDGQRLQQKDVYIAPQEYIEDGETVTYYGFRYQTAEVGFFMRIELALKESVNMVRVVFDGLRTILTGGVTLNDLAGPIGITATMATVAQESMSGFWYLAAMIAINLAVMNLLPIPALDGGRILFICIETIIRRKINPKFEGVLNAVVLLLLLGLMVVVSANDIWRLVKH